MTLVWFLAYVFMSTAGLVLIKQARVLTSPAFCTGFVLYAGGFVLWMYLLRRMPLSVAFPCAAGALIATTIVSGHLWLGERLDAIQLAGVAAIVSGIALVFSRTALQ